MSKEKEVVEYCLQSKNVPYALTTIYNRCVSMNPENIKALVKMIQAEWETYGNHTGRQVGDEIYCIRRRYKRKSWGEPSEKMNDCVTGSRIYWASDDCYVATKQATITDLTQRWNKTVFATREEAQRALEEEQERWRKK